jgi:hypothetical protein
VSGHDPDRLGEPADLAGQPGLAAPGRLETAQEDKPRIAPLIKRTTIPSIHGAQSAEWWGHGQHHDREPVTIIDCGLQIWRDRHLADEPQRACELPRETPAGARFTLSQNAEDIACALRKAGYSGQIWIRAVYTDAYRNVHPSNYTAFNIDDFPCP